MRAGNALPAPRSPHAAPPGHGRSPPRLFSSPNGFHAVRIVALIAPIFSSQAWWLLAGSPIRTSTGFGLVREIVGGPVRRYGLRRRVPESIPGTSLPPGCIGQSSHSAISHRGARRCRTPPGIMRGCIGACRNIGRSSPAGLDNDRHGSKHRTATPAVRAILLACGGAARDRPAVPRRRRGRGKAPQSCSTSTASSVRPPPTT